MAARAARTILPSPACLPRLFRCSAFSFFFYARLVRFAKCASCVGAGMLPLPTFLLRFVFSVCVCVFVFAS